VPRTQIPLIAEEWGLENTLCYVCNPQNSGGLQVSYFLNQLNGHVTATFEPGSVHTGAPGIAHGGIAMSLLDDGLAWTVVTNSHGLGLTKSANFEFKRPLLVGHVYEIECWLKTNSDNAELVGEGVIREKTLKGLGHVCTKVVSNFSVLKR
jgi:acyl-coenzyme A thioesterase PaaI-like protein|tara:strand:- start:1311 stop:1763 length:453 start_codon:yes stop_codon:yes gene_type:complete